MGNLQGIQINKIDGNLDRATGTDDSVVLLVGSVPKGTAQITHGKAIKFIQNVSSNLKFCSECKFRLTVQLSF